MSSRFLIVLPLAAALLLGCQLSGEKPAGADEEYFTWVDEQGQVRQTVIPRTKPSAGQEGPPPETPAQPADDSHEEYNLKNYPDGNALAERGFIRPGDPEPYFTWRDALGNVRVSYYRPDTRTALEKGEVEPPIELAEASIYQASTAPANGDLPADADPLAAAVLGLDDSVAPYFERWAAACCEELDRSDPVEWESEREFGVDITDASPTHEFITGTSHYRLVSLPEARDFVVRLRSYDQKGLFLPSLAFLDTEFRSLRLVTEMVTEFTPESWSRHGYLNFNVPVFPSRGERWLLIHTTSKAAAGQTVIETRYGPRAIPHQRTGELGLKQIQQ
jgi:maltose operon substrate-binding protein precursor MalM